MACTRAGGVRAAVTPALASTIAERSSRWLTVADRGSCGGRYSTAWLSMAISCGSGGKGGGCTAGMNEGTVRH